MTNPTLERAARALREHVGGDETGLPWDDTAKRHYEACVRAVLMAVLDDAPTKAMAESQATDEEGQFEPLCDLIGFSGENKTRTVLRQAWADGVRAILAEGET